MQQKNNTWLIIALIAAMAILYNPSLLDGFKGNSPPTQVATQEDPDDEYTVEDAAQNLTSTAPADSNNGVLATAVPPSLILDLGDIGKLQESIQGQYTVNHFDLNVATAISHRSMGIWCSTKHTKNIFNQTPYDPGKPDPDQMRLKIITEVPFTRYCVSLTKEGSLVGGIPEATISQLPFYSVAQVNEQNPPKPYLMYEEVKNKPVHDEIANTITTTNNIKITMFVEWGVFGVITYPENQTPPKILNAPLGFVQDVNNASAYVQGQPGYNTIIEEANRNAAVLADYGLYAPISYEDERNPERDPIYLKSLEQELKLGYSNQAPPGSPFFRLYADISQHVTNAGYAEIKMGHFFVNLVQPGPKKYYFLQQLAKGQLVPVISESDVEWNVNNYYPLFQSELEK